MRVSESRFCLDRFITSIISNIGHAKGGDTDRWRSKIVEEE